MCVFPRGQESESNLSDSAHGDKNCSIISGEITFLICFAIKARRAKRIDAVRERGFTFSKDVL